MFAGGLTKPSERFTSSEPLQATVRQRNHHAGTGSLCTSIQVCSSTSYVVSYLLSRVLLGVCGGVSLRRVLLEKPEHGR